MPKVYIYKNDHRLKDTRRFLRREANEAEKILWRYIRNKQLGYKFRWQHSIGNIIADFCCEELKLIIEVDGWTHDSEKTQDRDKRKEYFLKSQGYAVLRFKNEEMFGEIEPVLDKIKSVCQALGKKNCSCRAIPPPSPSP